VASVLVILLEVLRRDGRGQALRRPEVRAAIIAEYDESEGRGVGGAAGDPLTLRVSENFENMWVMGGGGSSMTFDYEPGPECSLAV
jgi:hypothetical protein